MSEITKIQAFIIKGEIDEALGQLQLLPVSDAELKKGIMLLRAQHEANKKEALKGVLTYEQERIDRNRTLNNIIEILKDLERWLNSVPPNPAYEAGRRKLVLHDYQEALALFQSIKSDESYFFEARLNACLAQFGLAETKEDVHELFDGLNTLEMEILNAIPFRQQLMERLLFNREIIYRHYNLPEYAEEDLEKLEILGAPIRIDFAA